MLDFASLKWYDVFRTEEANWRVMDINNILERANIRFSNIENGDQLVVRTELLNEYFQRHFYYLYDRNGEIKEVKSSNILVDVKTNVKQIKKERKYIKKKKRETKKQTLTSTSMKSRIEEFINETK